MLAEFLPSPALLATLDPLNDTGGLEEEAVGAKLLLPVLHTMTHMGTMYRRKNTINIVPWILQQCLSAGHFVSVVFVCLLVCETRSQYVAQAGLELKILLPQYYASTPGLPQGTLMAGISDRKSGTAGVRGEECPLSYLLGGRNPYQEAGIFGPGTKGVPYRLCY